MILSFTIEFESQIQFLNHWSAKYPDPNSKDAAKYDPYVGKPLTEESRQHLFEWKNGSRLSDRKSRGLLKHYPLTFPKDQLEKRYLDPKAHGGAIWNIFYMHCLDPETWPIFDQHTHRAMHYMKTGKLKEMSPKKAQVYESYKREFIPFVKSLRAEQRTVDKALFAFGKFLKMASNYC